MFLNTKRLIVLIAILITMLCYLSGCVSGPEKSDKTSLEEPEKATVSERRITVQELRTQAVSRRIGRWAVVVGISDYQYDTRRDPEKGIPNLKYAHRDAQTFAEFLITPAGGAFSPDQVRLLINQHATVKEVRKAIGDFLAQSLEDDLVILFFAGHGTPDPKNPKNLYFLCYDTEPGNFYGTALPMWEIDVALTRTIRSKRVFVLADACHSAGVAGTRAIAPASQFNKYIEAIAQSKEGITKITASRADELSQERQFPDGGHGVFTHYLIEGLKGQADEDADGFVTMKEAYNYLYDRVRSTTRHSQNPWASAYVSADIPLGIVDQQVLKAIEARIDTRKKNPVIVETSYQPPTPPTEVPIDSAVAVKLARARLAKGDTVQAKKILATVIDRHDSERPDALVLKIEILLKDNDLSGAEDAEDRLVIPYPDHPVAKKGAGLILDYYLKQVDKAPEAEKIKKLNAYLERHPEGPVVDDAKSKIKQIRSAVRSRYQNKMDESLVLVRGFIRQRRFDRARKELQVASITYHEARDAYEISLDKARIDTLVLQVESEETAYRNLQFKTHFNAAKTRFVENDYSYAYGELEKAKKWASAEQMDSISELASRYNAPPEVEILMGKDVLDWETPIRFKYRATDTEGDEVRVVSWDFGDRTTSNQEAPEHTFSKWEAAEKQKPFAISLKVTDGHSTVTTKKTVYVKKLEGVRDGHFIGFPNGVIRDTKTGLEWVVGPDKDTNWDEAKRWVKSLTVAGVGWRMPTMDELKKLYQSGKGTRNMTPLLKTTGWWVWSGETKDSSYARVFDFDFGSGWGWYDRNDSGGNRVFAVRSRR